MCFRLPWPPHHPVLAAILTLLAGLPVAVRGQIQAPLSGCAGLDITTTPTGVVRAQNTGPYNQTFTVTNCGSTPITGITLTCEQLAPVACSSVTPSSRSTLAGGASFTVTLAYSVGSPGIGQAYLRASWGEDDSAIGILGVTVHGPPIILLEPAGAFPASRAVIRNRMPILRALISAQYSAIDTTKTVLAWRTDTVTRWRSDSLTVARWNRGVVEWAVDSIRGLNGTGADSALITVTACAVNTLCTTVTRWAVIPNDSVPLVGLTGVPTGNLASAFAAPAGPGVGFSGVEVETGLATVPYFSMNAARSLSLAYSTRQSYPRVTVPVDLEVRWPTTGAPDQVVLRLFDGGTKLDSLKLTNPTCATGGAKRCRGVLQGDFSATTFPTPTRKWLKVEVSVTEGGVTKTATDSVEAALVDRRTTMYGSGWWPSVASKLVAAGPDRLLVGASGAVTVYRGIGDSLYIPPPGSFVHLTKTAAGWALRARGDSAVVRFDSYGRLAAAVDRNGNLDSLVYKGATDTLWKVRDPVGSEISLTYTSGKLSQITTSGGRTASVTVSSGLLTAFTPASGNGGGYTSTFAYQSAGSGTGTVLLQKRIGVIGDTTALTYDPALKSRPTQVALPKVRNESGTEVVPTITYTAVETRGIGTLVALDSSGAYLEVRDPRGHWTRSWPNRWGQARLTWDSLGRIARIAHNADGFVRWSEGQVADSSRTYVNYDDLWRLTRRYLVRPAGEGGVLRLDSLVYDANHRVIQQVDARGQVWKTDFDTKGNPIRSISPNSPGPDTTRTWYRGDGLVDSVLAPGEVAATGFRYSAGPKVLYHTITPSRDTVTRNMFWDGYGRVYQVDRKVGVAPGQVQWRRVQTFYSSSSNLVDSTRIIRTESCDTPCATPTWPLSPDTDSMQVQRVGFRYDRAGRDSARINDRGIAMVSMLDRLGRVIRSYPYGPGVAEVDSFAYDVAGNLRKTWTRRGHLITADYDSRNRDTLSVVPTVGTLRKAYTGPLGQLTRIWVTGLVDSVGNARPDVSLIYDQRGRLKADTVWSGTQARVTTYATDRYERDSLTTDALGAWRIKYETIRGIADTLATPLGDTLILSFDRRGRLVADSIRNGGLRLSNAMSYTTDGSPRRWSTAMHQPSTWPAGAEDQDALQQNTLPALQPVWSQKRGSAGATDTLRAELAYDGWERLATWAGLGTLSGGVDETYAFDRAGNLSVTTEAGAGAEQFDASTNRLLRRANGASRAWNYSYDAAGNLIQAVDSGTVSITYTYAYDALNRLVRVAQGPTLIARYAYDVLGRRIAKRVYAAATGGTVGFTRFVYHGRQVAFETDSAGSTIGTRYVWGPGTDKLFAFRTSASVTDHYYVATDKLGSVHQIMKRDGTWVMSYAYAPYGRLTTTLGSGVTLRYRWTGREYDAETGWYFHRARYYDPGQHRFVQEDPAGLAGGENRYAYVGGRVLALRDPSGRWGEAGPPRPFPNPCGNGGCYQTGIYIDGMFAEGWGLGMITTGSIHGLWITGNDASNYALMRSRYDVYVAAFKQQQATGQASSNLDVQAFWSNIDAMSFDAFAATMTEWARGTLLGGILAPAINKVFSQGRIGVSDVIVAVASQMIGKRLIATQGTAQVGRTIVLTSEAARVDAAWVVGHEVLHQLLGLYYDPNTGDLSGENLINNLLRQMLGRNPHSNWYDSATCSACTP